VRTIYSLGLIDGLRIRAFRSSLLAVMGQENNVKKVREARMLSKAELARLAGISPLTLDRIEKGKECRLATKRKILLALGLTIEQKNTLF
jgi:DNA-binding XRE family transcriptional regulator